MIIRILCLHGQNSNASIMKELLSKLDDRLWKNHQIELVYINGLIPSPSPSHNNDVDDASNNDEKEDEHNKSCHGRKCQWYHYESSSLSSCDNMNTGVDASIFHIEQIWNNELYNRPFHGIIAHGQSISLISYMMMINQMNIDSDDNDDNDDIELLQGCQFIVYLGDSSMILPSSSSFVDSIDEKIDDIDVLHIIPTTTTTNDYYNDNTTPNDTASIHNSISSSIYTNVQIKTIPSSFKTNNTDTFLLPTSNHIFNIMGKFITQSKHKILKQYENAVIVQEQQIQLTKLINESTQLLLNEIHNNPPKFLLAVISPNTVGGWMGDSTDENDDGGGAPCPSEFLLKEHDRVE